MELLVPFTGDDGWCVLQGMRSLPTFLAAAAVAAALTAAVAAAALAATRLADRPSRLERERSLHVGRHCVGVVGVLEWPAQQRL